MLKHHNDHSFLHSIRVCLYCFFLAKKHTITDESLTILMLSALMHDVAKSKPNDTVDHGKRSFDYLRLVFNRSISVIEQVMSSHSIADSKIKQGELSPDTLFLISILKDADAIDRLRNEDLNPLLLRHKESFEMINVARKIIKATKNAD